MNRIAYLTGLFGRDEESRLAGFIRHRNASRYPATVTPLAVCQVSDSERRAAVGVFDAAVADIGSSPYVKSMAEAFVAVEKPTVVLGRGACGFVPGPRTAILRLDETWIANEIVDYLGGNGFGAIAYVFTDDPLMKDGCSMRRKALSIRVREAIGEHGAFFSVALPFEGRGYLAEPDFVDFCEWLKNLPTPCGVVVDSDILAVTVVDACRRCGLAVPNDISIVGVGDCEDICQVMGPPLTSVEIDNMSGGERAGTVLDSMLHGEATGICASYGVSRIVPRGTNRTIDPDAMRIVNEVQRLIRNHACDGCNVEQIIGMMNMPKRTVIRKYGQVTGRSLGDDIQRVRIATAKRLLTETDLPIGDVLITSGYNMVASSYRIFKDMVGMTMAEWRERTRKA